MNYDGGKGNAGVWQNLINQIPPHDEWIEPFLGGGALAVRIRPAARMIGIDRDAQALQAFQQAHSTLPIALHCCDGIEWLKHRFDMFRRDVSPSVAKEQFFAAAYRDARAHVPFVFVDAPYIIAARRNGRPMYHFEMSEEKHTELLVILRELPALVMVVHYPHPLYEKALQGWRTWTYRGWTRRGPAIEQVWTNFPEPAVLHDARFVGRDRRERERIRRRVESWRQMIVDMPAGERQAVLEALAEDGRPGGDAAEGGRICTRCRTSRPADVRACPVCRAVESQSIFRSVF
ncbi:MAG: hypothetical protein KF774_17720 [Planctomyces sp.]|nr:hypothetical protein [Planctomyces sp.]